MVPGLPPPAQRQTRILTGLRFPALIPLLLFSLFCSGGSTSNNGVIQVTIRGEVSDATSPSKPRRMAATTSSSGNAIDLEQEDRVWPITMLSDGSYEVTVERATPLLLEFYGNGDTLLHRILSSSDTEGEGLASALSVSANVNTLTTLQAGMLLRKINASTDLDELFVEVNEELFANPSNPTYTIDGMRDDLTNLSAMVATYGQLFRSAEVTSFSNLVQGLQGAFRGNNPNQILNQYELLLEGLERDDADALASAHEGAKNLNANPDITAGFAAIALRIDNTQVQNAFFQALEPPVFSSTLADPCSVTPGSVFQFTFPSATTEDILGISGFETVWVTGEPIGPYLKSSDDRTITWSPDILDLGREHVLEMSAIGSNGRITTTDNISIPMDVGVIDTYPRKVLPRIPHLGPVSSGDNQLILVTSSNSGHIYYLEKIPEELLHTLTLDEEVSGSRWTLPLTTSGVFDMEIHSGNVYIAAGSAGLHAFDLSFSGVLPSAIPPTASTSDVFAFQLVSAANSLYVMETNGLVSTVADNLLDTEISLPISSAITAGINIHFSEREMEAIVFADNGLYNIYDFDAGGNAVLAGNAQPSSNVSLLPNTEVWPDGNYHFLSDNTVLTVAYDDGDEVFFVEEETTSLGNLISDTPLIINEPFIFHWSGNIVANRDNTTYLSNLILTMRNISGNTVMIESSIQETSLSLYPTGLPDGLSMEVVHARDRSEENCSTFIYSIARDNPVSGSGNWFIQAHELKPFAP